MEGKVDSYRDSKVMIYIQAVTGTVLLSTAITVGIHIGNHHMVTYLDIVVILACLIAGIYLLYRAYQQFAEKYHKFALATAKKV